jgi:hypothetical protein
MGGGCHARNGGGGGLKRGADTPKIQLPELVSSVEEERRKKREARWA